MTYPLKCFISYGYWHELGDEKLTIEWTNDKEERKRTKGSAGGSRKEEEGTNSFYFFFSLIN